MGDLKLTKEVPKTVIDTDIVKVGQELNLNDVKCVVVNVMHDRVMFKSYCDESVFSVDAKQLSHIKITKPESKLEEYKVGYTYLIEDLNSCSRAYYVVTQLEKDNVRFLQLNSGKNLIVTEDDLNKYSIAEYKPKMEIVEKEETNTNNKFKPFNTDGKKSDVDIADFINKTIDKCFAKYATDKAKETTDAKTESQLTKLKDAYFGRCFTQMLTNPSVDSRIRIMEFAKMVNSIICKDGRFFRPTKTGGHKEVTCEMLNREYNEIVK